MHVYKRLYLVGVSEKLKENKERKITMMWAEKRHQR